MKGLLLKDWYVLLKQGRMMLFCIVLYTILSVGGSGSFGVFASLFIAMLPLTLMGIDERNKWDYLAGAMPYKKRDIVLSRYLLVGLGLLALGVIYIISGFTYNLILDRTGDLFQWETIILTFVAGLIYPSFSLPIVFHLGVEKARLWFVILTGGLAGGVGIFVYSKVTLSMEILHGISDNLWFVVVVSILLFLLSAAVSVRLYEGREF